MTVEQLKERLKIIDSEYISNSEKIESLNQEIRSVLDRQEQLRGAYSEVEYLLTQVQNATVQSIHEDGTDQTIESDSSDDREA